MKEYYNNDNVVYNTLAAVIGAIKYEGIELTLDAIRNVLKNNKMSKEKSIFLFEAALDIAKKTDEEYLKKMVPLQPLDSILNNLDDEEI